MKALVLLALSVSGCAEPRAVPDALAGEPSRVDSMGVELVVNTAPRWDGESGIAVAEGAHVLLPDSAGDETLHFQSIRGLVALPGGDLAVADAGARTVYVFGSQGRLLRRVGRPGEGPGELDGIWSLFSCDGSLVVGFRDQLDLFRPDGGFVGRLRSGAGGRTIAAVGFAPDCERVLVREPVGSRIPSRGGAAVASEDRFTRVRLAWTDTTFAELRPVAEVSVAETYTATTELGPVRMSLPWTPHRQPFALDGDGVVLGSGRTAEVRFHGGDGGLDRISRWPDRGEPVTGTDHRRYEARRAEYLAGRGGDPDVSAIFPRLGDLTAVPSAKPVFDGMLVDDEGRIWLRRFPSASLGAADERPPARRVLARAWVVIDASGVWLGDVEMPAGLEPFAIRDDVLYGIVRDAFDVERVAFHRIRRR